MSGYRPSGGGDIVEPPIDSTLAISTEGASFSYVEAYCVSTYGITL